MGGESVSKKKIKKNKENRDSMGGESEILLFLLWILSI